ncbi:hypothetical protein G6F65_014721 [Rhizopus arrhizus]|nr:hypothetical protein G6F65_014721 [Rhizopus arrhizus]
MHDGRHPHHPDGEVEREELAPDHDAAGKQPQHAQHQHVEQQLLASVVLADFGQLFFAVLDHVVQLLKPLAVGFRHYVVPPHVAGKHDEAGEHHHPDEGVQDTRPRAAAKQVGQPVHRRVEQRQSGQRQQDERKGNDPVVGALARRIALDPAVTVVFTHGAPPLRHGVRLLPRPRCGPRGRSGRSPPRRSGPSWPRPAPVIQPGLVGVMQHIHDVGAAHALRVIQAGLIETAGLQVHDPFFGMLLHVFLGAEHDGAGGTGLDARRLLANGHAVGTQGALVRLVVFLGYARHIERAAGDAVAATNTVFFVEVHDAVGVLDDGARRGAGFQTARVLAVHAAVLADQPFQVAGGVLVFREAHDGPGMLGQVGRVVVDAHVGADLVAQIVPFHTGALASLAPDALGDVDQLGDRTRNGFTDARRRAFSTLTRNDLNSGVWELPSPTTGVNVLVRKPGLARPTKPQWMGIPTWCTVLPSMVSARKRLVTSATALM